MWAPLAEWLCGEYSEGLSFGRRSADSLGKVYKGNILALQRRPECEILLSVSLS